MIQQMTQALVADYNHISSISSSSLRVLEFTADRQQIVLFRIRQSSFLFALTHFSGRRLYSLRVCELGTLTYERLLAARFLLLEVPPTRHGYENH